MSHTQNKLENIVIVGNKVKVVKRLVDKHGHLPDDRINIGDVGILTHSWADGTYDVAFTHVNADNLFIEVFSEDELEFFYD